MRIDNMSSVSTTFANVERSSSVDKEVNINPELSVARIKPSHGAERQDEKKENMFKEELDEAVEKANSHFNAFNRKFEISVHEKTNRISVKILDTETNEVIREIPPEKMLDLIAGIWEAAGIAIDKKI